MIGRGSLGKVMHSLKILKQKALIAKHQVDHTNAERKTLHSLDVTYRDTCARWTLT